MVNSKILVVEDDPNLLEALRYSFQKEGYQVTTATDGAAAIEAARRDNPNLILLDVMLPVIDGFEVCRILRRDQSVPILMLTAKDSETDKVVGLEIGADDYVTKPFSMRELLARIRAMLRRGTMDTTSSAATPALLQFGELMVDVARHQVTRDGQNLELTPKEFELLAHLARHPGLALSREQLLAQVWGYDYTGNTRTVDVHVRWLRRKIERDPGKPERLLTVRGVGYKLVA